MDVYKLDWRRPAWDICMGGAVRSRSNRTRGGTRILHRGFLSIFHLLSLHRRGSCTSVGGLEALEILQASQRRFLRVGFHSVPSYLLPEIVQVVCTHALGRCPHFVLSSSVDGTADFVVSLPPVGQESPRPCAVRQLLPLVFTYLCTPF